MGFGIRLPGIGISTRGVRVGPRLANVRVGRGGVRASAGPRIANVSVGRGGARVGSGVGPLFVSNRGVGVSVGGIRVSNRGVGATAGVGPFWFGSNARWPSLFRVTAGVRSPGRRNTGRGGVAAHPNRGVPPKTGRNSAAPTRHSARPLARHGTVFAFSNPHMLQQFNAYRNHLATSGVKRRNKYEVRAAAAEALFLSGASLVALLRSYGPVSTPPVPDIPSDSELRRESRRRLRERREISMFSLGKKVLVDGEMTRVRSEIAAERMTMEHELNAILERVRMFVEPFSSTVMDALLADNLFPARWVGQSSQHAVVVLAFGDVEEMVWPEEMQVTKSGGVGVRKVTKDDLGRVHRKLLFRALLSTGKEILAASTNLKRVTVIAVDGEAMGEVLTKRDVWGFTTVERRHLPLLTSSDDLVLQLISLEESYNSVDFIDDEREYSFFSQLIHVLNEMDKLGQRLAVRFMSSVFVKPAAKGTGLEPIGTVENVFAREAGLMAVFRSTELPAPFEPEEALNLASLDYWLTLG